MTPDARPVEVGSSHLHVAMHVIVRILTTLLQCLYACSVGSCDHAYNTQRDLATLAHANSVYQYIAAWVAATRSNRTLVDENALLLQHVNTAHPIQGKMHPRSPDQIDAMSMRAVGSCSEEIYCVRPPKSST